MSAPLPVRRRRAKATSAARRRGPAAETPARPEAWVRAVMRWYRTHRRSLPWRGRVSPYAVWISEIMLQQTQVNTVLPYYRRFVARFPDISALAAADVQEVLKAWEGLGYYARARNLCRAAAEVVQSHKGVLPADAEALRRLPGIGDYTAGAILSICFDMPVPAVDGNVARVLTRFLGADAFAAADPKRDARVYLAPRIPTRAPGDFNQALMEIGALVCRPAGPHCKGCPLRPWCVAAYDGPSPRAPSSSKRTIPHRAVAVGVIRKGGRVLIARRRPDQMLGGLWEFPGGKRRSGERLDETARCAVLRETGLSVRVGARIAVVRHVYSHLRITLHAFECSPLAGRARPLASDAVRWVRVDSLDDYPFSAATRKVIAGFVPPGIWSKSEAV